jgi:hypothetical protein
MTNATMFVYTYGIAMKQGTSNAWSKINELSKDNDYLKKWFESPYVQTANQDEKLLKELDTCGL